MKKLIQGGIFLGVALALSVANGATLYKWIDSDGNVVYQDTPPPSNATFEETEVEGVPEPLPADLGQQIDDAALANPISLYSIPVCDSCDLVRLLLEKNSIPFAEKNVQNNVELQAELKEIVGAVSVPTLSIGDTVIDGFSRTAIKAALVNAGFPIDVPATAASQPNTQQTTGQTSEQAATQSTEQTTGQSSVDESNDVVDDSLEPFLDEEIEESIDEGLEFLDDEEGGVAEIEASVSSEF